MLSRAGHFIPRFRFQTMPLKPRATIDFETRSACNLERRGAWLYSKHPTTELLCLSYHLPGMDPKQPKLWHRAHPDIGIKESPPPTDLFEYIESGGMVEAHNAFFEMCIWRHVAAPVHKWPRIKFKQWSCSAAKAAAHSLPRNLAGAIDALNLPVRKSEEGKSLLRKYSFPKKLNKEERELWGDDAIIFNEDSDGLARTWEYCRQDVRGEQYFSESVPDLTPAERDLWQITQLMNFRGVLIDTELARAALELARKAKLKANRELFDLTGIEAGSQRAKIKEWLEDRELLILPDTKAKTVEWFLEREEMTDRARRVLQIMKEVNRTSTNKFARMLECVDDDDRARELLLYCGAERTGRFAGRGIQIHNLPKGKWAFKGMDMDTACADVKTRDLEWCESIHGDVMNLIASCLRGAIIAPKGRDLLTADYAAIEARCVLWEAGADSALEIFRTGGDIYCDMASGIYGYPIVKDSKVLLKNPDAKIAQVINSTGATQRDFGKVAVLGLGYGMGYLKFLITLRTYNIYLTRAEVLKMMGAKRLAKYEAIVRRKLFPKEADFIGDNGALDAKRFKAAAREAAKSRRALTDEREEPEAVIHELTLCKYTVDTYRRRYEEVPAMWKAQEAAAIRAVQTNKPVKCGVVTWHVKGRFLKCRLPSGRTLNYCDPEIKMAATAWGEKRPSLRFMGIDQKTKRWVRQHTYGGKLTENITQAIARDIMAIAKRKLAKHPDFDLLISVHDEIVAETDARTGEEAKRQEKEFEALMSEMPPEFDGCPIAAESKRYGRYRK